MTGGGHWWLVLWLGTGQWRLVPPCRPLGSVVFHKGGPKVNPDQSPYSGIPPLGRPKVPWVTGFGALLKALGHSKQGFGPLFPGVLPPFGALLKALDHSITIHVPHLAFANREYDPLWSLLV